MDLGKLKKGFYKKIKYRVGLVLPGNPDILFEIAVKKENVRQREYAITILDSKRVEVKGGIYLPGRNSIDITQKLLDEADKAYKAIFE